MAYAMYKKYLKYFSVRFVQALIQSRLGDEVESKCVPYAENTQDWFNLKLDELGEISAYLKANIKNYPPAGTLTLEFLLYTPSGQCLPLEAWVLSTSDEVQRGEGYPLNDVYHQMSTLLRSAIVSSRMTPMHRLYVRKQSVESFVIMYRVFENDVSSDMGKGKRTRRIGELVSQHFGTITLDLHYRTSMHFEEPETAPVEPWEPERVLNEEQEEEENECDKTLSDGKLGDEDELAVTPKGAVRVPTSPRDDDETGESGGSSVSRETAPRFILGQSTSSEESRDAAAVVKKANAKADDDDDSDDDEHRPSLANLRNHSFPFVNLLQSAYNPANGTKKNASTNCLNSQKVEEEVTPTKIDKVVEEEEEENERDGEKEAEEEAEDDDEEDVPIGGSMELSEDSFVHFNQLSEFSAGSPTSQGHDLGDYLRQLTKAPDMRNNGEIDIVKMDLKTELEKIGAFSANFNEFIAHINSISDD